MQHALAPAHARVHAPAHAPPCSDLPAKYHLGKVIGAGSFGTVREAVSVADGQRYAVKTVAKMPKRGAPTPR